MNIQSPLFGIAILATTVFAEAPRTVLFQGTISKSGTALTGNHKVAIGICESDDSSADDCTQIFTNDAVPFTKGYYSVLLGEKIALPAFDQQYYLEVTIDGTTPESRIALSSAPSAINAINADLANKAILADSTKGGALRAVTATKADFATKMAGITSEKDTTFLADGVISLDDTVTLVSKVGTTTDYGVWSLKGLAKNNEGNLTLSASHRATSGTAGNASGSTIAMTNEGISLNQSGSSWSGTGGGGSGSTLSIELEDITMKTQTINLGEATAPYATVDPDSMIVNSVFRTTQPAVLIIPTNSSICENDPCSIDGQLILATSIVCNGGSTNYATANKLMVCRSHYAGGTAPQLHWNAIE